MNQHDTVIHHTSRTDTMVDGTLINEIHVKVGTPIFTIHYHSPPHLKQADQ